MLTCASTFLIGSFLLYTRDRFLARRAAELLASQIPLLDADTGVIMIDDIAVQWRCFDRPAPRLMAAAARPS